MPQRLKSRKVRPVDPNRVFEVNDPQGGRNKVRKGDVVHVDPSAPGKKDGYDGRFLYATTDGNGVVVSLEVFGGPKGKCPAQRSLRPSRVRRVAQTAKGEKRDLVR